MKKVFLFLLASLRAATALLAQTPEEIIARMDRETDRFEAEGFSMVMEIKVSLLGSIATTVYSHGDKYKMTMVKDGTQFINWSDGMTSWEYDSGKNTITIENAKPGETSDAEDNAKMLDSVTKGYDVKLRKETAKTWEFRCTKSKDNTVKDDPKTMDLVVAKDTYLPVSLKAGKGIVSVILRDFAVGVADKDVTFDASQYPQAQIIDKR